MIACKQSLIVDQQIVAHFENDTLPNHISISSNPGVAGSIPIFSSPCDETINRGPLTIFQDKELTRTYCKKAEDYAVPNMSHLVGKPTICIGENKGADQLRGNREADQRHCFRCSDSTIRLLLISNISSF